VTYDSALNSFAIYSLGSGYRDPDLTFITA